ncbi:MAG: thioredoxin domain-containing protein [Candidatus Spechtbacteria bacterium SB0662_bin_43]|uniref:Thioredoxin domain-containing protein n=1 Tax=Candidatus Spechtbacteria bacterium SB0662_bin_43 TaxID=2604897 RepID=A0A845DAI0_9BACT|nr:thioredoxin domain-containing protein [Candidatus Spechtbacteria bacterium SB0662_bin_43]
MEHKQEKMSKHERKEHLRQQRQSDYDEYQKKTKQKKIALWIGGLALLAIGAGVLFWAVSQEEKQRVDETGVVSPIAATDNTFGNPDSSVELIEYGDFECPACAGLHPVLKEIKAEYSDRMQLAYRHFPLPFHRKAKKAAYASEAARAQGKFWEMHDLLFERQGEWVDGDEDELFESYAQEIGLDVEKFSEDIKSDRAKDAVEQGIRSGKTASVSATPSLFLNGELVRDRSLDGLRAALDQALQDTEEPEESGEVDSTDNESEQEAAADEDTTVDSDNDTAS